MRVLVTGGSGFIGSHIVDMCLESGHNVVCVDDMSSGRRENLQDHVINFETFKFKKVDIVDYIMFMDYVLRFKIDVICHQAAQPSLRRSIDDPVFDAQVNIIGTLNIIELAKRMGAHLVFASTSAVYDPNGELPYRESDCVKPHLPYGIAKATAERYIQDSGVSHTILRYGNVYGPRQVEVGENQLIPHCLNYLLHNKPFVINGDGYQTRDFVYVEDIARANLMAMEKRPQGIFNCGYGSTVYVNEVCDILNRHCDEKSEIKMFDHGPAKEGEVRNSLLDSTKSFTSFGWRAETKLQDGLRNTYEWAKTQ